LFLALVAWMAAAGSVASAIARPAPKYLSSSPDQAEGARLLATFRHVGIRGGYWLGFELRVMPRRGPERDLSGHMFGLQGRDGPLTRLTTNDPALPLAERSVVHLLQAGSTPSAWRAVGKANDRAPQALTAKEMLTPIHGTDLTPFDLLMPFLHWTDFVYEGVANVRGRPAHACLLYPPGAPGPGDPTPAAVRVFLDTQFQALTQAEWLHPDGKVQKSFTVLDLKKSGEQWLVKTIDLRNHDTRVKTRLTIKAAALDLELPPSLFTPAGLARDESPVPAAQVQRF
jgi:hypothetical protein